METQLVCTICGYAGEANKKARGNGLVEFILWCFFLVPGIIYSIWSRGGSGKNVCPKCGSTIMIPANTPIGQKLMAEQRNNPDMQLAPQAPQKTSRVGLYVMLLILAGVAIMIMVSFSIYKRDAEKMENDINAQQVTQQNSPVVQSDSLKTKSK